MANGTIDFERSAASGSYIEARIEWSTEADTASNSSKNTTAKLYVRKGSTDTTLTIPTTGTWTYKLAIAGNSISGSLRASLLLDWVLVATHKISSIPHENDGSKTVEISGSVTAPHGTSLAGHSTSGKETVALDAIERVSAIVSAGEVSLGSKCSVKWTPASAAFCYKLKFSLGDWSFTTGIIKPNTTVPYIYTGFVIPLEVAGQIPDAKSGLMTVGLYTYSDSSAAAQVGNEDVTSFAVIVPENADTRPVVTMALSPVSSLAAAFDGLYIQGKTKAEADLSAEGKLGASIQSYGVTAEGSSYGEADEFTTGYLANFGDITVTGSAKDSRGIVGTVTEKITVIPYGKPKILDVTASRCAADGNITGSGTYLRITARRSYSPVKTGDAQKNFCQIQYRYKAAAASTYSEWATILTRNSQFDDVDAGALLGGVLSPESAYVVQVRAIDDVGEYSDTTINISTDEVYMHRTKNALGLGKYAEGEHLFDCGWDAHFHGEVRIGGVALKEYILSVINEGG